jgi:ubiquinone/menaquinone biosynthesis C-methylase UbiE
MIEDILNTDNYKKHTTQNPAQKFLINNFLKTFLNEAKKLSPQSILDVGCGEGFTLEKLRENKIGKELMGIDFSKSAIEIGKKMHPSLTLKQGTIYHIPLKPNSFDLIICSEVLEHLKYPEKALQELVRVTKKNCIISVPNEPWFMLANLLRGKNLSRWGNDIEHIQHWSKRGISAIVEKYFAVTVVKNPFPWTLLVAKKR